MKCLAAAFSVLGALGGTAAAVWLLVGFNPDNPRYVMDGMNYPGERESTVLPNLLRDQRKVAALITASTVCQLVGVVLGIWAD
jgi:hypothetical protein